MRTVGALLLAVALSACIKDRVLPEQGNGGTGGGGGDAVYPGLLKVNEFVAYGSTNQNEFGVLAKWFEIYNTSAQDLVLESGKWFVTDAGEAQPTKFQLPQVTIEGHGFLVVWCDNNTTPGATQVYANFSLSSSGEHIMIYYKTPEAEFSVDDYSYGPQTSSGASMGRSPDGSDNWMQFTTPTPGAPNP
jgi:hypothetical protein